MAKPTDPLRKAREAAGLTLEDVKSQTHIRLHDLRAVEEGDFDALPGKYYTRTLIRKYGDYLGVDPAPILQELEQERTSAVIEDETAEKELSVSHLSRKERYRAEKEKSLSFPQSVGRFLPTWLKSPPKKYVWILLAFFALLIPVAIYVSSSAEDPSGKSNDQKSVDAQDSKKNVEDDAVVELVKASETYTYGDMYEVSKADEVQVTLEAKEDTWYRYRAGGPTKKVKEEATIQKGEKKTFRHPEWVSLLVENPNQVKLTFNGHVISTEGVTGQHAYQLKLKK